MSLKENVNFIKEEMSTEEKFFEGFFKLEKFWKKYKIAVIGTAVVIVLSFVGLNVNEYLSTQTKIKVNNAFNTLLENPNNSEAIAILQKDNPQLLTIAKHIENQKKGKQEIVDIPFLQEISKYNIAINKSNLDDINKLTLNPNFLLKEFATFQKALVQASNGKYKDAKETLKLLPENSSVNQLATALSHYLLTK